MMDKHIAFCPKLRDKLKAKIQEWFDEDGNDSTIVAYNTVMIVLMGWVKSLDTRLNEQADRLKLLEPLDLGELGEELANYDPKAHEEELVRRLDDMQKRAHDQEKK